MSMVRKMILEEFTRTRSDYLELGDVVHNGWMKWCRKPDCQFWVLNTGLRR